jgi:hypothetical protein
MRALLLTAGILLCAGLLLADDPVSDPAGAVPGATTPAPSSDTDAGESPSEDNQRSIEMHLGVPGLAYLGQPLEEFEKRFPSARRTPFAGQENVLVVRVLEAGISCYVVGETPGQFSVASVGFNFEEIDEGVGESGLRTIEGIGKGSTVNDVLGTYGLAEITGARRSNSTSQRQPAQTDPNAPMKYLYPREDGKVTTYFLARGARVVRVVINDVPLLDRSVMKRRQSK